MFKIAKKSMNYLEENIYIKKYLNFLWMQYKN